MGKICSYANKIDEDLYLCSKYKTYCNLDEPEENRCKDLYGDETNDSNDILFDDEENVEELLRI